PVELMAVELMALASHAPQAGRRAAVRQYAQTSLLGRLASSPATGGRVRLWVINATCRQPNAQQRHQTQRHQTQRQQTQRAANDRPARNATHRRAERFSATNTTQAHPRPVRRVAWQWNARYGSPSQEQGQQGRYAGTDARPYAAP